MKVSTEGGRPVGVWCSWNEFVGTGDGTKTEFTLPFTAAEARGLLVTSDYATVEPDGVFRVLDTDGKVLRDEPDGWALVADPDPEKPAKLIFQRPRRHGARVAVGVLDRHVGDSFKILGMDTLLSNKLDAEMPKDLKGRKRDELAKLPSVVEMCRLAFMQLVTDWTGITDENGNPKPCDPAAKKLLLDRTDAIAFGMFAMERARTIQRERLAGFEASVRD
jgi:hypothetical protein